jgi:uncharacterized membrane protein YeiH
VSHLVGLDDPYLVLEVTGTIAFAISGGAVAARAGYDWLGMAVLAAVTSVGGGTLRDLLLHRPVAWIGDPWPVWLALGVSVVVMVLTRRHLPRPLDSRSAVLVADAVGLAAFTVAGTVVALSTGVTGPVAVLLGVVTGTGGGVIRDVLARERPLVLVGQVYALSAAVGATALVVLLDLQVPEEAARWTAVAIITVLRLLAIRYDWTLPRAAAQPEGQ